MEAIFPANSIDHVGFYGGRISQGILGEPLNQASDLCFLIFVIFFLIKLIKEKHIDKQLKYLSIIAGFMAFGSLIFHSYPNKITLKIDMIPINIFGLTYIYYSMRRYFNYSIKLSSLLAVLFCIFSLLSEALSKSIQIPGIHHLTTIIVLQAIGLILIKNQEVKNAGRSFLFASVFYIAALFFRFLDLYVYKNFPLGTHFLWHTFSALVVVVLLYTARNYGYILQRPENNSY